MCECEGDEGVAVYERRTRCAGEAWKYCEGDGEERGGGGTVGSEVGVQN